MACGCGMREGKNMPGNPGVGVHGFLKDSVDKIQGMPGREGKSLPGNEGLSFGIPGSDGKGLGNGHAR